MSAAGVVAVTGFDVTYDWDGIALSTDDDGRHLLQLRLGMAYDSHSLSVSDEEPGVWTLLALLNLVIGREQPVCLQPLSTFGMDRVGFDVPDGLAQVAFAGPNSNQRVGIRRIEVSAALHPFRWTVRLFLCDARELCFDRRGWTLIAAGQPATRPRFVADFDVSVPDNATIRRSRFRVDVVELPPRGDAHEIEYNCDFRIVDRESGEVVATFRGGSYASQDDDGGWGEQRPWGVCGIEISEDDSYALIHEEGVTNPTRVALATNQVATPRRTPAAPVPMNDWRCPRCGSVDVTVQDTPIHEFLELRCNACHHEQYADEYQRQDWQP